jgi:hypothetical protein
MMYNNKNQKKNYGYFNKQKNGGNEKWDFDCKLFHVCHLVSIVKKFIERTLQLYVDLWKEKKNGSNKSEFVVREGDLEYESSICCMVA